MAGKNSLGKCSRVNTTTVLVELDRWEERGKIRAERLDDESVISLGLRTDGNNKIIFNRTIQLGKYAFRVFVTEYRGETTFMVRAAMAIRDNRRKRRDGASLRERALKPAAFDSGEVYWTLDRTGVFAGFPEKWDDYWANTFITETLNFLRSPEIPKHFELHGDNPEEY